MHYTLPSLRYGGEKKEGNLPSDHYHQHDHHLHHHHLECDGLVRFCSKQEILPATIRGLYSLLIGRHEAVARVDVVHNFRVVNL